MALLSNSFSKYSKTWLSNFLSSEVFISRPGRLNSKITKELTWLGLSVKAQGKSYIKRSVSFLLSLFICWLVHNALSEVVYLWYANLSSKSHKLWYSCGITSVSAPIVKIMLCKSFSSIYSLSSFLHSRYFLNNLRTDFLRIIKSANLSAENFASSERTDWIILENSSSSYFFFANALSNALALFCSNWNVFLCNSTSIRSSVASAGILSNAPSIPIKCRYAKRGLFLSRI